MTLPRHPFRRSVAITESGDITTTLPGRSALTLSRFYAPAAEQSREALLRLRQELKFSRAAMAALLGVPFVTLRKWETGERNPSMAARKLIWVLESLFTTPERLTDAAAIAVWKK